MTKTSNIIVLILRWIFFVPLAITIYIVSKICLSWTFYFISSQTIEDLNSVDGYGGHYFLGPIFIFITEALAIGFGIYTGIYLVPKLKKKVFVFFILLYAMFLLSVSFAIGITFFKRVWNFEMLLRNLTEIIAQLVGLVVSGIYIWKEQSLIENKNYTDFELLDK